MGTDATNAAVLLEDEALRDGLQMEARLFSLEEKLHLFSLLKAAGLQRVQVGSFVHPTVVPQMADTDDLIRRIGHDSATVVSALILNEQGLDRAQACGVDHVTLSASVSDTHSRNNTGRPAAEALDAVALLIRRGLDFGLQVRGGLQCVFGCVYEGAVSEDAVLSAARAMAAAGAAEVNLADTTGMANPLAVRSLVARLRKELPDLILSLHLHDTRGLGLANMVAGYECGIRSFDVCVGGLGGCPFVKGAAGNVPTEDAVHLFEAMGVCTGVDLNGLCRAVGYLEERLGRTLPGHMKRVLENRAP